MEFDLHIHSKYSYDSFLKPKKIVEIAYSRGLSGIAITDHNTIKGALEASKYAPDGFIVVIGSEIDIKGGQILGLFLKEEIKSKNPLDIIREIKGQGGLIVLAHPAKRRVTVGREILSAIDAIEGFNARIKSLKTMDANSIACEIARELRTPVVAGSDAHFAFEIGRGRIILDRIGTQEELKERILKGEIKISGYNSSLYLEPLSKLIKSFKMHRPQTLLSAIYHLIRISWELGIDKIIGSRTVYYMKRQNKIKQ